MKCQKCGKEEVNFHYSSNINGEIREIHLCSGCTAEAGYAETFNSPDDMLSGALDGFFSPRSSFFPLLGMDMSIRSIFGAPPNLSAQVREREKERQPSPSTEIKVEIDGKMQKRREINILREQMRQAAATDDFEKATELRDKIRDMEREVQG